MSYSLNTTILNPLSKEKPKNAVILCHGYGGDGKDISLLASYWRTYLPDTIFVCPDAPEKCAVSASGFQWFDLMDQTKDQVLVKSLVAEIKLNNRFWAFLDIWLLKSQVFVLWPVACCVASAQVHFTPFHPIPSLHNSFHSIHFPPSPSQISATHPKSIPSISTSVQ